MVTPASPPAFLPENAWIARLSLIASIPRILIIELLNTAAQVGV